MPYRRTVIKQLELMYAAPSWILQDSIPVYSLNIRFAPIDASLFRLHDSNVKRNFSAKIYFN